MSTHIGLVSRAFGASALLFDVKDSEVKESIDKITAEWGGGKEFTVGFIEKPLKFIERFSGDRIHLTMYGLNINSQMSKIKESGKDKLVIVGGKKVPSQVYHLVDYNIAVGNQPHSEVAALAVFLDRLFSGVELEEDVSGGRKVIVPQAFGKKVVAKEGGK